MENASKRNSTVVGEFVGIEENFGSATERVGAIEYRLILKAVVFVEVVFAVFFLRGESGLLIIIEFGETLAQCIAERNLFEVCVCYGIFLFHPFESGGSSVVFERTIRVGDFHAEVFVDGVVGRCRWVFDARLRARTECSSDNGSHEQRLKCSFHGFGLINSRAKVQFLFAICNLRNKIIVN